MPEQPPADRASDHGIVNGGIAEFFVEGERDDPAVDHDFPIAEFPDPAFRFFDDSPTEPLSAIVGKNDYAPQHYAAASGFVEPAGRNGITVIQKHDISRAVAIVSVKLFPQRDMVLSVHPLYPDGICSGPLPFGFSSQDFDCRFFVRIHMQ